MIDVKEIIKDTVRIEAVAEGLGIINEYHLKKTSLRLQGECPTGHASTGGMCFNIVLNAQYFYCWSCNITGDIYSLVEIVLNYGFKDSLQWIAENYRPDLVPQLNNYKNESPEQRKKRETKERETYDKTRYYELVYEYGKEQLYKDKGKDALNYLVKERGYKIENLLKTEWIYFAPEKEIRIDIASKQPDTKKQKLQGYYGDNFRLAFPCRDKRGAITGFIKKSIYPEGATITTPDLKIHKKIRYDATTGTKKTDIFNLNNCRGEKELLIVEGYPDALYLPTLGLKNVVAAGQGLLAKSHLEGFKSFGIERVIVSFDNQDIGLKNTETAIDLLKDTGIKVFVIDPPLLGQHKDPDEFVIAKGIEPFKELMKSAQLSSKWLAQRICTKHDLNTDIESNAALDECIEVEATIKNVKHRAEFKKVIRTNLNIPEHVYIELTEDYRKRKNKEKFEKEYQKALKTALVSNNFQNIKQVEEQLNKLRLDHERANVKPVKHLSERLKEKKEIEDKRKSDNLLGYKLNKFKTIEQDIDGLQAGLYVIGAKTSIGKTAFLSNLTIDILDSNPEIKCIYFSLDDNEKIIITRLLAIISKKNITINNIQRPRNIPDKNKIARTEAYETLITLADSGRLDIKDLTEVSDFDSIERAIRENETQNLFVAIDGIYNIEADTKYGNIREVNIERANKVKLLADTYGIPIIVTGELKKDTGSGKNRRPPEIDDLMETSKFGYNANCLWLLSPYGYGINQNFDQGEYDDQDEPIISLHYAKNKLSGYKGRRRLRFYRSYGKMTEETPLQNY